MVMIARAFSSPARQPQLSSRDSCRVAFCNTVFTVPTALSAARSNPLHGATMAYREFEDVADFVEELEPMLKRRKRKR